MFLMYPFPFLIHTSKEQEILQKNNWNGNWQCFYWSTLNSLPEGHTSVMTVLNDILTFLTNTPIFRLLQKGAVHGLCYWGKHHTEIFHSVHSPSVWCRNPWLSWLLFCFSSQCLRTMTALTPFSPRPGPYCHLPYVGGVIFYLNYLLS